ncbi:MAG TPA: DMT family transporter [Nitrospiria bacterium]|nr:DMT family transporter [Nitrospiria bacterium]
MTAATTSHRGRLRTGLYTSLALAAFAANSILCRVALRGDAIDATSFTAIRLVAGAATLWLLVGLRSGYSRDASPGDWFAALALCVYAVGFSYAYLSLSAGTGALVLFGGVQLTMLAWGLRSGERPHPLQWIGLFAAASGLVTLVSPGVTAPSPGGAALMASAGIAWGVYSLRGRGATDPAAATADNFLRAAPLGLLLTLAALPSAHATAQGLGLAVVSGSLTSGIGYVIWYAALRGLTATRAAVVQLAVPVLVAFAGILFLSEPISPRLVISAVMILGGVALTLIAKDRLVPSAKK